MLEFSPCASCQSPMACRDVGTCHIGGAFPVAKLPEPCAGCVTPTICSSERQQCAPVRSTANNAPARQDDLDFHIRAIQRLVGEEVIENPEFRGFNRANYRQVDEIVAKHNLNNRLRAYLVGMLGLE